MAIHTVAFEKYGVAFELSGPIPFSVRYSRQSEVW